MGLDLDKAAPEGDGAPETEVTSEMVEAGVSAFLDFDPRFKSEAWAVVRIYKAMWAARPLRDV